MVVEKLIYHGAAPDVGAIEKTTTSTDVGGAIVELHVALDNFVTQLHYTTAKTKRTHVYAALRKLGGTWTGVGGY